MNADAHDPVPAPMVSALVPAYDAEPYLARALGSALSQTLRDIEVIAVDDGPTDGSWDVIAAAARRDRRGVGLLLRRRGGPSAARNAAIARASGRRPAPLDARAPERLTELVAHGERLGADLVADDLRPVEFGTGRPLGRVLGAEAVLRMPGPLALPAILRRDMPDLPRHNRFGYVKPLIRRVFLADRGIRYHEDLEAGEDFMLHVECILRGRRSHLAPGARHHRSVRGGSASSRPAATAHRRTAGARAIALAGETDAEGARLPRQREIPIDFGLFRHAPVERKPGTTLAAARRLPAAHLARRLLTRSALPASPAVT